MATETTEEASGGSNDLTSDRHALKVQEELWVEALGLAAVVESAFALSVTAFCSHRPEPTAEVKAREREIDRREVGIENACLRVLVLYEPVASDFRRVLTVLRVNRNLERIGDLAVRIATRAKKLASSPVPLPIPEPLEALAEGALCAVRGALDALAQSDAHLGRSVIAGDRRLDEYQRTVRAGLKESIRREPGRVDDWLRQIEIARHLERAGDHAVGIAEAVIYLKEGQIIRHERFGPEAPGKRAGQ
jgi:phosphate transport system protein